MPKYTMSLSAAKRVAAALTLEDGDIKTNISFDDWRKALHNEGFDGFTASNACAVLRELQAAGAEATADNLARRSFYFLIHDLAEMRAAGEQLHDALGALTSRYRPSA